MTIHKVKKIKSKQIIDERGKIYFSITKILYLIIDILKSIAQKLD